MPMMPFALALQTAAALNLMCVGTLRTGPVGIALPEAEGEPFEIVYRIDLAAGSWCADACETSEPIAEADGGYILLRDRQGPNGSHVITLFPAQGRFTDTLIEGETATLRSGRCLPAGFEGVPDRIA